MIEMKGEWIHVSISGESRGWIRKSQVEFPEDSCDTRESATDTVAKSAALFRMAREEVATFPGDWQPLRGKSVKIYSVQPAQSATSETSAREKREFVRELFLRAWKEHSSPDAIFFSSRRRHTRLQGDWSSDVCSSDCQVGIKRERLGHVTEAGAQRH